jgi:two-component system sensor histidine kinase KdpD
MRRSPVEEVAVDRARGVGRRRRLVGLGLAVVLPVAVTAALVLLRDPVNLVADALLLLLVVVVVSLVGGLLPAVVAAVIAALLLNYYFTEPLHTLDVSDGSNVLALALFVLVGVLVSSVVEVAARLARRAAAVDELAAADRLRTALLAAVGHDLRTPLASAKASVASLRSTDVTWSEDDRDELLLTADESLDRLARLVDNLLDMSRLTMGAMTVQLRAVALDEVVPLALDDLGPGAGAVLIDVPDDLRAAAADPGLLERVIVNLVQNALRYNDSAQPVRVLARAAGDRVELRIVDHGPGIATEQRERVFVPFQRLGDTDNTTGIGLGLALSRGLTEAMGGTLDPEPTSGGGLTMVVSLPAAPTDRAPTGPGRRERDERGGAP